MQHPSERNLFISGPNMLAVLAIARDCFHHDCHVRSELDAIVCDSASALEGYRSLRPSEVAASSSSATSPSWTPNARRALRETIIRKSSSSNSWRRPAGGSGKKMQGMITGEFPDGPLLTGISIVSTLYFEGTWKVHLEPRPDVDFHVGNGEAIKVDLINIRCDLGLGST